MSCSGFLQGYLSGVAIIRIVMHCDWTFGVGQPALVDSGQGTRYQLQKLKPMDLPQHLFNRSPGLPKPSLLGVIIVGLLFEACFADSSQGEWLHMCFSRCLLELDEKQGTISHAIQATVTEPCGANGTLRWASRQIRQII